MVVNGNSAVNQMNDVLHFFISFIDKVMHRLNLVSFCFYFLLSSVFLIMSCFVIFLILVCACFFNLTVNYYVKFKYNIILV